MRTDVFWLNSDLRGRLAVAARPRGGEWLEEEIGSWKKLGIDVIACLLTNDEMKELDLMDEASFCKANGLGFVSFPISDYGVPESRESALEFLKILEGHLLAGKSVVVHCRQGLGRSPLIAACLLVMEGHDPEAAIRQISTVRGRPVPETTEQRRWVEEFARGMTTAAKE